MAKAETPELSTVEKHRLAAMRARFDPTAQPVRKAAGGDDLAALQRDLQDLSAKVAASDRQVAEALDAAIKKITLTPNKGHIPMPYGDENKPGIDAVRKRVQAKDPVAKAEFKREARRVIKAAQDSGLVIVYDQDGTIIGAVDPSKITTFAQPKSRAATHPAADPADPSSNEDTNEAAMAKAIFTPTLIRRLAAKGRGNRR